MSTISLRSMAKNDYAAQEQTVTVGHIRGKKQTIRKTCRGRQAGVGRKY